MEEHRRAVRPAGAPQAAPGQRLGRYEILSELGAGAMGSVFLARDTTLDRQVALKLLPPAFGSDPERAARFSAEAKAASALNHPNILTIYDIGQDGDLCYIAMEFVDGVTLRQRLAEPIPGHEALEIILQCAAALQAAHETGVVHRDIKPENIMIRRDGLVKVVDFGLARAGGDAAAGLTRAGAVIGTPRYMSPEQAHSQRPDARTDVFSLGAVLYELFAGQPAVPGESSAEVFAALLGSDPLPPLPGTRGGRRVGPSFDRALARVLARALHKDPSLRYPTMLAFATDLVALGPKVAGSGATPRFELDTSRRGVSRSWRWIAALAVAAVLVLLSVWTWGRLVTARPAPGIESLAVLPLVNLSNDPGQEFLVDGITDQLTAEVSRATALRVISRTSAMKFKGTSQPLPEIARMLNVDAVVEGSVRWAGGRVVITAQLVDARGDRHLWARTYERHDDNLPALTEEVARDIGRELGRVPARPGTGRTRAVDPAAYERYLRGRHAWNQRTTDGYRAALEHFNAAIAADPAYAPAYAGLADTYLLLGEYLIWPSADAFPRARAAAARAIALDDSLAEPYASLGQINANEWRWADADREFQRAIERDPAYATGRQWRAEYLAVSGRADEALAEIRRAQELDPLSLIINVQVGWILTIARQPEAAIAQLRRTIDLAPGFAPAYSNLGIAYDQLGRHTEAIDSFETAVRLGGGVDAQLWLARQHALAGSPQRARELLDRLLPAALQGQASTSTVALVYDALGDKESALWWLQKGCERRSVGPANYPPFDRLRADPRFTGIMGCMGLTTK